MLFGCGRANAQAQQAPHGDYNDAGTPKFHETLPELWRASAAGPGIAGSVRVRGSGRRWSITLARYHGHYTMLNMRAQGAESWSSCMTVTIAYFLIRCWTARALEMTGGTMVV